jgi:hypothetical protein
MNGKLALKFVIVFAMGTLLLAGSASAQFTSPVKVSNVIEGTLNPPAPGVSTARCGSNIVVGFADREPSSTGSSAGFSVSKDGGKTFSDLGTIPGPAVEWPYGGGDSALIGCSSASNFYYANLDFSNDPNTGCFIGCTEISLSTSINGGSTWSAPVVASWASADIYELRSPALAIDPTNPKRLYAAYINKDVGPYEFPGCSQEEWILEVVTSGDGGKTWNGRRNPNQGGSSAGVPQPDFTCDSPGFDAEHTGTLVSPTVIVSPGGKVYVAYEFVAFNPYGAPPPNEIRFTRSLDAGKTFSAPIVVSKHAIDKALPQLAVDRTVSSRRGEIYLTWSGALIGTYTDVLVSDSVNFGLSFSFPRPVSAAPAAGVGRFQTNPVVAVDNDGQVVDCYYSTANNHPTSSSVYSYNCAESFNHAASWVAQRLVTSAPVGYDAVTGDFLLHNDGFFTAFELQASGQRHVVGEKADNP